ncbi:hypothetical protein SASPL_109754 [Salvia splendens]|uniref:Peptidyl-tRNA hydrolase, PTH1 family n=1 Tax=Salvia splendens TaxID=180675 RepID=A0A8X9A6L4_SALSN|nr:hypothetical protein SASPL_109754 [Salvia splendens]
MQPRNHNMKLRPVPVDPADDTISSQPLHRRLTTPVIALLIMVVVLRPFIPHINQILGPNSDKKIHDSLIMALFLFAVLCGIFSRRNDEDDAEVAAGDRWIPAWMDFPPLEESYELMRSVPTLEMSELGDEDATSVRSDEGDSAEPFVCCDSPDVNALAETFIARLRHRWMLEKMSSPSAEKERENLFRIDRRGPSKVMLFAVSFPNTCTSSSSIVSYPRIKVPIFNQKHSAPTRLQVFASTAQPNGVKTEYTPWLIVGLGNPGNKYHGTRHNVLASALVGFEMVDRISQAKGIVMNTIQAKALVGIGSIGQVPVLLAKPQTYMNFSGEAVGSLAAYYQVPLRHILLVYDEMSLPNGVLRLQPKGGHGHHNGVKSVMEHLDGRREFPRFCIGIGNPPGTMDMKAFLLQKFSTTERKQVDAALEQGIEAARRLVLEGFSGQVKRFNLGQKYKYHQV